MFLSIVQKRTLPLRGKLFEITKATAPALTWTKQAKAFASSGEITNADILAGLTGANVADKAGYTIKSVRITDKAGTGASVDGSGTSAKITSYTKPGTLTLTLVFEHSTKANKTIADCEFDITKLPAPALTWTKQEKAFATGGSFTTDEILAGVQGTKDGYTVKEIASLSADIVTLTPAKKALNFKNVAGTFTATIILEHSTKADVTLTNCEFEITKLPAPTPKLTWTKQDKPFATGGSFTTANILDGVSNDKKDYTIKSISVLSTNPNNLVTVSSTKTLNFRDVLGSFTVTIILEHPTKADVTLTNCEFEITRGPAERLTFQKVSKVFSSGGSFSVPEILAGVRSTKAGGTKAGYSIKDITTISPNIVTVSSTKTLDFMNVAGSFTATIILQHNTKADVTIPNCEFEITKTPAESFTFDKLTKLFTSGGSFSTSDILNNVRGGDKTGYTLKNIGALSPSGIGNAVNVKPNVLILFVKAGLFKGTLTLEHPTKADATILNCEFEINKTPAESLTFRKTTKIYTPGVTFTSADILSGVQGTKSGYTLKSITNISDRNVVNLTGSKPNFSFHIPKKGAFTATLTLEHPTKGDVTINGAAFTTFFDMLLGGDGNNRFTSVIQTSDGGYVMAGNTERKGVSNSNIWVIKLDSNGDKVWEKTFGGSDDDVANSIVQTKDGGYAVAGYTSSKGAGDIDVWVLKLDGNGNKNWDYTFGGANADAANSIVQTKDEGYAVAGFKKKGGYFYVWVIKLNKDGKEDWNKEFGENRIDKKAYSIVQTKDSGYAVAGFKTKEVSNVYNNYIWVLKLDKDGDEDWNKEFRSNISNTSNVGNSIVQTSDDGYAVAGILNQ